MRATTTSEQETRLLGAALGRLLAPGDVVTLSGDLGAGKTTFSQGIGLGLGVDEPVTSPTFALVHEYEGRIPVWHLDTYRVGGAAELVDLSWDDLLAGGGAVLVEWPERIAEALPPDRLEVRLSSDGIDSRHLQFVPHGLRMTALLLELEREWAAVGARSDRDGGCR
ncbi:MAG: tRNA (adenosine(37)-N6)-threonylcarbamoyltransferase complex ATPase subunit type 1 TsaE [Actinomycetota bacterium]